MAGTATVTGSLTVTSSTATVGGTQVVAVAPGSNGNVLTSNGTAWTSAAPASSGVTSAIAGNGITVSSATGAVTISQDIYTGTSATNTSYPIGSYVLAANDPCGAGHAVSSTTTIYNRSGSGTPGIYSYAVSPGTLAALTGTWRCRGAVQNGGNSQLWQRTA